MKLNSHHAKAAWLLVATAILVVFLGVLMGMATGSGPWHGMYCTTGFATTAGCDIPLHGWQEYLLGELSMVLVIPLWAAVFSFITAGLTADHVDKRIGGDR